MTGDVERVTLAQIVAALSVTYTDEGLTWLTCPSSWLDGRAPIDEIRDGRIGEVAKLVAWIGDADPRDFTVERAR